MGGAAEEPPEPRAGGADSARTLNKRGFYLAGDAGLQSKKRNLISALEHPEVVSRYLAEEIAQGRVIKVGSDQEAERLGVHCSPFGVIPKRNRPNKWRLIIHLSAPEGESVNDGISKELSSLSYVRVDDVVDGILQLGRGALMAKMDIRQAYRNVPVHPQDRLLVGMRWQGQVYVDAALPFGLRSAPLIFTVLADVAQWLMRQRGVAHVDHYIDDFVTLGPPGSPECARNAATMHEVAETLGLPPEPEKDEGPATTISFLGMELDSAALEVRLPPEKLHRMRAELARWRGRKACRKRELLSLIGVLSHACKAVRAGRSFLRRLIDLSTVSKDLEGYVRLNREAKSDIEWWYQFCDQWNGVAMMRRVEGVQEAASITSDASGGWGCVAYSGTEWFMLQWVGPIADCHITAKEMVPVVIAAVIWGNSWRGKTVRVWSDNAAVVSTINSGVSRNQDTMHLARCLAFITAKLELHLVASHISGVRNVLADALSRDNLPLFRSLYPQANPRPTPISDSLLDLLLVSRPDWTSRGWTVLWNTIFFTV